MAKNNQSGDAANTETPATETPTTETTTETTGDGGDTTEAPAENSNIEQVPADPGAAASGSVQTDGARQRRAFMLKQFIPNPDWINTNVVAGGKGTRATVGRIWGYATGYEDKTNTLPDGKVVASIAVKGVFQSESYVDGVVSEASMVFFPMAYAEKIKAVFDANKDVRMIEVDCDIGLEATGKTIPYEWVVVAFREGEEMAVLKRLRASRARPVALITGADGKPAPALTDQSK